MCLGFILIIHAGRFQDVSHLGVGGYRYRGTAANPFSSSPTRGRRVPSARLLPVAMASSPLRSPQRQPLLRHEKRLISQRNSWVGGSD